MRLTAFCLAAVAAFCLAADPDPKAKPREVKIVTAPATAGKGGTEKFTSAEALAKAHGKEVADAVAREVNFKSEYAVVSSWSGSGGDKVEMAVEGKKATFTKTLGRTRDLRRHFKVFALPAGYTYEAK